MRSDRLLLAFLILMASRPFAGAYVVLQPETPWPYGDIPFDLQFGDASFALSDGNTSWDQVALGAMAIWNQHLLTSRFTRLPFHIRPPRNGDRVNHAFWSTTVYGHPFPSDVIAITTKWRLGSFRTESDIIVRATLRWDSYRDGLFAHRDCSVPSCAQIYDLQRTLVHELGHSLGLGHPDEEGQEVVAIMNSRYGDITQPTNDDLAGAMELYPPEHIRPAVTILAPGPGARFSNSVDILVTGRASDNSYVSAVFYQANAAPFTLVEGLKSWEAPLTLVPGSNTFRVFCIDTSGNRSATNSRTFSYVVATPLTVNIQGQGQVTPNLNGKLLEFGKTYTLTARPGAGYLFSNWTGGVFTNAARLNFVMQSNEVLEANFVPNPFLPVRGSYNGLFYAPDGVLPESAGFFAASVTERGTFSGQLQLGGRRLAVSGPFDLRGKARQTLVRLGALPLTVELTLELGEESGQITGQISDGTWTAMLLADRAVFHAATNAAPYQGKYTLVIPGSTDSVADPAGDGFGLVTVERGGRARWIVTLADGTVMSPSAPLSRDGQCPLYAPLYAGKGLVLSWVTFSAAPPDLRDSSGSWSKPTLPFSRYYPKGFTNELTLIGSSYHPPPTATNRVLALTNGVVALSGGNLSAALTNPVVVSANNKVTSSNKTSLSMALATGLFRGNAPSPVAGQTILLRGALLQKQNRGAGFFLGTNQSGKVYFGP